MDQKNSTMIYLFHGDDDFSTIEKVKKQKERFTEKHGDINLSVFDEYNFSKDLFIESILSSPFLGDKRLVVVENGSEFIKKPEWDNFIKNINKIPDTTIIFFLENKKLKKDSFVFEAVEKINIKESNLDRYPKIGEEARRLLRSHQVSIDGSAESLLLDIVGNNNGAIYKEIEKLILYAENGSTITKEMIEKVSSYSYQKTIFSLTENLAQKDLQKSYDTLNELMLSSDNNSSFVSMIAYQFRILIIMAIAEEKKIKQEEYAKVFDIKPYPLQKSRGYLKKFNADSLSIILKEISQLEIAIKTGETQEEPGLQNLIMRICTSRA